MECGKYSKNELTWVEIDINVNRHFGNRYVRIDIGNNLMDT